MDTTTLTHADRAREMLQLFADLGVSDDLPITLSAGVIRVLLRVIVEQDADLKTAHALAKAGAL